MALTAEEMKAWRVRTGRTTNLVVPVATLATLLSLPVARSVLHYHLGLDLCRAIEKAPKASGEAA